MTHFVVTKLQMYTFLTQEVMVSSLFNLCKLLYTCCVLFIIFITQYLAHAHV